MPRYLDRRSGRVALGEVNGGNRVGRDLDRQPWKGSRVRVMKLTCPLEFERCVTK